MSIVDLVAQDVDDSRIHQADRERYVKDHTNELYVIDTALKRLDEKLVRATVCADSIDLHYSGDKHDLAAIFSALRKLHYEPNERPSVEPMASFSTYFKRNGFRIWLSFVSTKCTRIQTGTKTVEAPIYEIVCE